MHENNPGLVSGPAGGVLNPKGPKFIKEESSARSERKKPKMCFAVPSVILRRGPMQTKLLYATNLRNSHVGAFPTTHMTPVEA